MRWDWVETKHKSLENLTSLSWLPLILNDISDELFPNRRRALQLIGVWGPGFTSTRLARYTSAFTTVFYRIARAGLNGSLYKTTYEPLLEMKEKKVLKDIKKIFDLVMSVLFFRFEVRMIGMEQN